MRLLLSVLAVFWLCQGYALSDEEIAAKLAEMESRLESIKQGLRGDSTPSGASSSASTAVLRTGEPNQGKKFWNENVDGQSSPRVYLFTFMDKMSNYGCASVRSAITSHTNVTVFGLSETLHRANGDRYHGFRYKGDKIKKVFIMHKYLESLQSTGDSRDDDIIIFNDGFDVLYTPSSQNLVDSFQKVEKPNTALFAAERTCFPKECKEQDVGSTFRYVNSGDYIARFPVALRLLRTWVEVMRLEGEDAEDQTAVHEMILGRGNNKQEKAGPFKMDSVYVALKQKDPKFEPVNIAIDSNCAVFQTGMKTKLSDGTWKTAPTDADNELKKGPYLRPDGVIYNTETRSEPLFVHFNGERFWFMPVEQVFYERFSVSDTDRYNTLCHRYLQLYPVMLECSKLLKVADFCQPGQKQPGRTDA